jgi:predicted MFS family arabinose efflux permease
MNSGRVIGPGIAAGLIALVGTAACFYANAASYVAVLVALAMMRRAELLPMQTVNRQSGQLRLGLRYVFETPLLRNVILAVAVIGTFAFNFTVTLPLLAHVTFHQRSAAQYGLLMGSMGIGAVVGGLWVAHRSRPTPKLLATLAILFGICMSLVAFAPTILLARLALIPTGACSIAFLSTANSTLQLNSGQQMRGRVMSLYSTAFLGTTPIGAPLVGLLIAASNPRMGIFLGAALTLATGVWLVFELNQSNRSSLALNSA